MIDFEHYEKNKGQTCLNKWSKIPQVKEAMDKMNDENKSIDLAVKLEENRVSFLRDGNDAYLNNMMIFVKEFNN